MTPDQPDEVEVPPIITAIEMVMRPGGWLSGPCPEPVDDEDES